jgi:PAS domain S-box-containing protein
MKQKESGPYINFFYELAELGICDFMLLFLNDSNNLEIEHSNKLTSLFFDPEYSLIDHPPLTQLNSYNILIELAKSGHGFVEIDANDFIKPWNISGKVYAASYAKNFVILFFLKGSKINHLDENRLIYPAEKEEVFRQLAENINDVFMLRDEKEFLYINSQFEKIWGRKKTEIIENPYKIVEWIHPEDTGNIETWVNFNQLIKGKPYVEQFRIIKPDGTIRWIWTRTFPVLNEKGLPYRIVSISSDITEQKDFEGALRTAKEKAQESDLLKSTFLANISHEIRTPMNGIIGFAELLNREDLEPSTRKNYLSIMKKSSDQLIRIIDDIIDFAKIESNQIRTSLVEFNLNVLIDELYVFYEKQMNLNSQSSISLITEKVLKNEKALIVSDDHRIRQILSNLLDNAIKYTDSGHIQFGYKLKNNKIEFFVKDSGIGIPKDKHDLIFERFRQVDEGHTRKFGGTGLGLPISKGLVNILGGSIWLESNPDSGSAFYFTIPYQTSTQDLKPGQKNKKETVEYEWKDKLILVAEDDDLNFEYIKILFEPTHAKIIRAKDGSQAIKICSNINFDLILMDIRLPILNGIKATQHIREMGIKTPIIAQTAFAMGEDEQICLDAGCNCYIVKPISREILFTAVESLIHKKD